MARKERRHTYVTNTLCNKYQPTVAPTWVLQTICTPPLELIDLHEVVIIANDEMRSWITKDFVL